MLNMLQKALFGFFIVGFATNLSGYSPSERLVLNWSPSPADVYLSGKNSKVLDFDGAKISNEKSLLPEYSLQFDNRIVAWFGLMDPEYRPLEAWESALVDRNFLNQEIKIELSIQYSRGNPISLVSFIPFRIDPVSKKVEKLISFDYSVIEAQAHSSSFRKLNMVYADNSVLSQGSWLKIGINKEGVHKIGFDQVVSKKSDFNGIAVDQIKLFGNGGTMLPQKNDDPRIDDLRENKIMVRDNNSNGIFDQGDYLVFYATDPHHWELDNADRFLQTQNSYSDTAFYFLTHSTVTSGQRVQMVASPGTAVQQTFEYFDNHLHHEKDLVNILGSGREWYGESFDFTLNRIFDFDLGQVDPASMIWVRATFAATSLAQATEFSISVNGSQLGSRLISPSVAPYGNIARSGWIEGLLNPSVLNNGKLSVKISYNKMGNPGAEGLLNAIRVQSLSKIEVPNRQLNFRNINSKSGGIFAYKVFQTNQNMEVWDVSDPQYPQRQNGTFSNGTLSFSHQNAIDEIPEFVVFDPAFAISPVSIKSINNQNLHSHQPIEMLIIAPDRFSAQAQTLSDFRLSQDGISSRIVSPRKIYNEFSSGSQDISAIRNYLKMIYDRDQSGIFKYVLLFGDCSYDYKDKVPNNSNLIPVYESYQSLNNIDSYSSDDYFGFMEDGKGEWSENNNNVTIMDVGVGRLPVNNSGEAADLVNKIIHYSSSGETYGSWRTWITFVADDGDNNTHQKDADALARKIANSNPEYNIDKIFLGSYDQLPSPAGALSPAAKDAVSRSVEDGSLILNYSGHGGPIGWTEEQILRTDQIISWENLDMLTFFFTATCEYGRYDDPEVVSGGELSLLNSIGGAVGLMTTTRPVYSFSNFNLNSQFYGHAFQKENGDYLRLGEIIRRTKNGYGTRNTRNFALLGDPSMKLDYPHERIRITKVNQKDVSVGVDTMKALCLVSIKGEVVGEDSARISSFNGIADGKFFDKALNLQTLVKNGPMFEYTLYKNLIYKGFATVNNGEFEFEFVVPKDIDYNFGKGRVNIYASTSDFSLDASGSFEDLYVGGSCDFVQIDNDPPDIVLYLDDTSFVNGAMVGSDPALLAFLEDENGINITGTGIGRGLNAWTTAMPGEKVPMNDYFQGYPDTYKKGLVNYQFKDFKQGNHTLTFKAWDTHNNSAEETIDFVVAGSATIALSYLYNYPNPFYDYTNFGFDHNRAGEDLDIELEIMSIDGRLLQTRELRIDDSPSIVSGEQFSSLTWRPGEENEGSVSGGLYFFKMTVRSKKDGSEYKDIKRMVYIK
jgi:Peptidase family C25